MIDLNVMLARSYLNIISSRSKDLKHSEHIDNTIDILNGLETWRQQAIKRILEDNKKITILTTELQTAKLEISKVNSEADSLERENMELRKQMETLLKQLEDKF